jgi:hypothetical protein
MPQQMKPKVWPTDKPFIVFMVPGERSIEYASIMNSLITDVLSDFKWPSDAVDAVGLIASTARHGTEGIFFLEEMGVDTRSVTLLILWAETAESVNFVDVVPEECGIGAVILSATGVVLPTVRMPSLDDGWWEDPLHYEYASTVLASLIRDGRTELSGAEPFVFVTGTNTWN